MKPWVIVNSDGAVKSAHCTCMAGLAEACSHVAALLFFCEFAFHNHVGKSCTDVAAYWPVPSAKQVPFARIRDIDFRTSKRKCEELEAPDESSSMVVERSVYPPPSPEAFHNFLQEIHNTGFKSSILSLVKPFSDSFVPKAYNLGIDLRTLFKEDQLSLSLPELSIWTSIRSNSNAGAIL